MRNRSRIFLWSSVGFLLAIWPVMTLARAVISEVMWMGSDLSTADEWVEVVGTEPTAFSGWTLTSLNASGNESVLYRFGAGDMLDAGQYIVISNYRAADSRLAADPRFVSATLSLPNTKLLLRLRDASDVLMDEIDDGVGVPFAGSNSSGGTKASMERIDLAAPGNVKENWMTAERSQGFDDGAPLLGTPGFPSICLDASSSSSSSWSSEEIMSSEESSDTESTITSEPYADTNSANNNSDQSSQDSSGSSSSDSSEGSSSTASASSSSSDSTSTASSSTASVSSVLSSSADSSFADASSFASQDAEYPIPSVSSDSSDSSVSSSTEPTIRSGTGASIRITELLPDALGSDDASWIEIGNLGSGSLDVAGWRLEYGTKKFVIPQRNGTGFVLAEHEHVAFRRTQTTISLLHAQGTVTLRTGTGTVDSFTYAGAEEGISFGRDPLDAATILRFCVSTEGAPNVEAPWDPFLRIQSGTTRGEESVTLNLEAVIPERSAGTPQCTILFGDGTGSNSCNPAAHTYDRAGHFIVRAEMVSACGNTRIQEMDVDVLSKPIPPSAGTWTAYATAAQSSASSTVAAGSSSSRAFSSTAGSGSSCVPAAEDGIVISELLPDPAGSDTDGEWVELRNLTDGEIRLCGWSIGIASANKAYPLDAFSIPARSYLLLTRGEVKMQLRNSEETIRLFAPGTASGSSASGIADEVRYEKPKPGQSYARDEDGAFSWTITPTPGAANLPSGFLAKVSKENTKVEQKKKEETGTKSKSSTKKTTKKTATATSKNTKRRTVSSTTKKSSSSQAKRPLTEDAAPLLAEAGGVEGMGLRNFALSPVEWVSLTINAILLGLVAWQTWRRKEG